MTFFQLCLFGVHRSPYTTINVEGVRMNKSESLHPRTWQSVWDSFMSVTVGMLAMTDFRMDSTFGRLLLC